MPMSLATIEGSSYILRHLGKMYYAVKRVNKVDKEQVLLLPKKIKENTEPPKRNLSNLSHKQFPLLLRSRATNDENFLLRKCLKYALQQQDF